MGETLITLASGIDEMSVSFQNSRENFEIAQSSLKWIHRSFKDKYGYGFTVADGPFDLTLSCSECVSLPLNGRRHKANTEIQKPIHANVF